MEQQSLIVKIHLLVQMANSLDLTALALTKLTILVSNEVLPAKASL